MLRRELIRQPKTADSAPFRRLLECPAEPAARVELLLWRWQAAGRCGDWRLIVDDLQRLEQSASADEDQATLLLAAVDQLVWFAASDAVQAVEQCRRDVERLIHVHDRLEHQLDRMDLAVEMGESWRQLRGVNQLPASWIELVPSTWTLPADEVRDKLISFCEAVAAQPETALNCFDLMAHHSPHSAWQLGSAIEHFMHCEVADYDARDDDQLRRLLRPVLLRLFPFHYAGARQELLKFCVRELIDPEEVLRLAVVLNEDPMLGDQPLSQHLEGDGPLRFVYLGCRAFTGRVGG